MKNAFKKAHFGHGVPSINVLTKTKRADCSSGLYKGPTAGETIDASKPLTVNWDASCFDTPKVDIYLYAPTVSPPLVPLLHSWTGVKASEGTYSPTLDAGWWGSASSMSLYVLILPADSPSYLAVNPVGPVFTATYSGPATEPTIVGGVTKVDEQVPTSHGLKGGRLAAAVVIPLLVVIALGLAAWIKIKRSRGMEKRQAYKENVDKRMSTISVDWKSMSGAGANAAIRNSMAVGENRNSSFSFGGIRPASTVAVEGGQAGIGSRGGVFHRDQSDPQMSQLRPGVRSSAFENRVSRVSFAADTRPSMDSRKSRAYQNEAVPPLPPIRQETSNSSSSSASPMMSPTQTYGALTLTPDDIRSRMAGDQSRPSIDEVMPALSLMRTGGQEKSELLFEAPAMPSPTFPKTPATPKSPVLGVMQMQPMPANVMSPDEMLRAYAARRAMGASPPPSSPALSHTQSFGSNSMRTLYSPENNVAHSPESTYPSSLNRKSLAPTERSRYDDDDAYA